MWIMQRIYLDHNAAALLDPVVRDYLKSYLDAPLLNPSSLHEEGRRAKACLLSAREKIAKELGVTADELIFTSGATEAIHLAIHTLVKKNRKATFLSTEIDHPALYEGLLSHAAGNVAFVPVDFHGMPSIQSIEESITEKTGALLFSAANSETGVKLDIEGVAALARKRQLPLFLDATAWVGREPFKMVPGITGIAFSSFKMHGPAGVGALIWQDGEIAPFMEGGGQERGMRSGTENLFGILGMAKALEIAAMGSFAHVKTLRLLRDNMEKELQSRFKEIEINGSGERMAHVSNLYIPYIEGDELLIALDRAGIAASLGSACSSGSLQPSRTLLKMGYSAKRAQNSLRISLSRMTLEEEISLFIDKITSIISSYLK